MELSDTAEEVAGFYARMLDHDYTTRDVFNTNFFKDWRKVMTQEEKSIIKDLKKCNFREMDVHFKKLSEERKNRSKEEKKVCTYILLVFWLTFKWYDISAPECL